VQIHRKGAKGAKEREERAADSEKNMTVHPQDVRGGIPDDFDAIWAINAEGQPGVSPFSEAELTMLLNDSGHVVVTIDEDGEQVAGYCVMYRSDEAYDGEEFGWFRTRYPAFLYIDQIAIAGRYRRAGVGTLLYGAVAQEARAQGHPALACEVNVVPPNPTSLTFHKRMGFMEVGTLDTSDGRSVTLLVKAFGS
jgi:predicted GNAT superfamily acetyltransferase